MTAKSKVPAKYPTKSKPPSKTKKDVIFALLRRNNGASLGDLETATGWQAHSIRGFLSGTVRKKLGLNLVVEKHGGGKQRYFLRGAK